MKINQVNPDFVLRNKLVKAANLFLYVRISLLQQEATDQAMPFILLASADSAGNNNGGGKSTTGSGSAGAGRSSGNDDDNDGSDEIANPSADLVKNTGDDIRVSDFDDAGIAGAPVPDPTGASSADIQAEKDANAMSPGGTGEDRIIGGDTDREIDWNDIVDEGTGEADAATS